MQTNNSATMSIRLVTEQRHDLPEPTGTTTRGCSGCGERRCIEFATNAFRDNISGINAVEIKHDGGVVYDQSMRLDGQPLNVTSVEKRDDWTRYNLSTPLKLTKYDTIRSFFCGSAR
jgi:hypothetical protein